MCSLSPKSLLGDGVHLLAFAGGVAGVLDDALAGFEAADHLQAVAVIAAYLDALIARSDGTTVAVVRATVPENCRPGRLATVKRAGSPALIPLA